MENFAYANENEVFSALMDEFVLSFGCELLRKNERLKTEADDVSPLAYARCRDRIRREFAALRRRGLVRSFRISAAVACAAMIVAAGTVLLVPGLHDAVLGRSETVIPMTFSGYDGNTPAFRRNMPPLIPDPEETEPPSASSYPIVSKDYLSEDGYYIDLDAYLEAQRRAAEEEYARQHASEFRYHPFNRDNATPTPTPSAAKVEPTMVLPPDTRMGNTRE